MAFVVAAFYRFAELPDCAALQTSLAAFCQEQAILGTILIAPEGINGTVAGTGEAIDALFAHLAEDPAIAGRLAGLEVKRSTAAAPPFRRLKVKLKREIVTLGIEGLDPARRTGTLIEPADWNALIAADDVVVIDTRNSFEVEMGSFEGAVDPRTRAFSDFPAYARGALDPARHKRVAMFCTGGIRCEKASAFLLAEGFEEVLQLKGGILRYLEDVPAENSLFRGRCFVFDERVALGHGLVEKGNEPQSDDASSLR